MIGKQIRGKSFRGLVRYLARDPERVAWTGGFNIIMEDPIEVAREMEDVAVFRERCKTPVFHLTLSWHPDDKPTQAHMELASRRVLARLGLQEHQAWLVAHNDTPHAHIHLMVNRVPPDPKGRVWGRWGEHGRPWTCQAIESELRLLEQEMGWTVTPGRMAVVPGHDPPARAVSPYRMRFGAEITVKMGPVLQNARSWKELQRVLQQHGMRVEARKRGAVITDGSRYIGACRIRGLKGGRPDLEERFGQSLDDFLATGQSPEPIPAADWVWKVRVDSLHHARRHFNKTPELYALYKESLAWRAADHARANVAHQERRVDFHRGALQRAERQEREAEHTRLVLLQGLRQLLRGHTGLQALAALASLTAALTKLGVDGVLAVMRQDPARVGLPPPSRKRRRRGDADGPLESELRRYAFAGAERPTPDSLAQCRAEVAAAERGLRAAQRDQAALARSPEGRRLAGMQQRRRELAPELRRELTAYELGRDRERAGPELGL